MTQDEFTRAAISAHHALLLRAGAPGDELAEVAVQHALALATEVEKLLRQVNDPTAAPTEAPADPPPPDPPPDAPTGSLLVRLDVPLAARLDAHRGRRTREQLVRDLIMSLSPAPAHPPRGDGGEAAGG